MRSLHLIGDPPEIAGPQPSAVLGKGFRPFFLLGAIFAAIVVPWWVLALSGVVHVGGNLDPVTWHAHEMVFGFAAAIVAGFLLTAVGNWTQRETAIGAPLLALVVLWLAGRVALAAGALLPAWVAAAIDTSFLPGVALAIGRPLLATKNKRNFVVLGMLVVMALANLALHVTNDPRRALVVGVDAISFFMVVIAGRVVPMFTRNSTRIESIRGVPRLDMAAAAAIAIVLVVDASGVAAPALRVAAYAVAAALVAARTIHWGTRATFRDPLLWILHVGHAWIPIGLFLRAAAAITPRIPASAGLHAITAGAIGAMTLGMMARVALGHTGRLLVAPRSATIAFVLVTTAALVRVVAPLLVPAWYLPSLSITAVLWATAFALYAVTYAPFLLAPRVDGKPG